MMNIRQSQGRKKILKGRGDICFVLDTSPSMRSVIKAVRENVRKFVDSIKNYNSQIQDWDIRMGFVAGDRKRFFIFDFSDSPESFSKALDEVKLGYEEVVLMGIDLASSEMSWREDVEKFLVVITDETIEENYMADEQIKSIDKLMSQLSKNKINTYIIAPYSEIFNKISKMPGCMTKFIQGKEELRDEKKVFKLIEGTTRGISQQSTNPQVHIQYSYESVFKGKKPFQVKKLGGKYGRPAKYKKK